MRQLSFIDKFLCEIDTTLRTLVIPMHRHSARENPSSLIDESLLNAEEKQHTAGLMRVNHAGEVSAQALYQGQALTAQLTTVKQQMTQAAAEEVDHLAWCEQRLQELDSQPSILNPLWYSGSLLLGMLAGLIGDRWSLGFVAETERQVTKHLEAHLKKVPAHDLKTKAILEKMQADEAHHAEVASAAGGAELPFLIKKVMQGVSMLLTKCSYYF